jgi:dienelactone hydrolase
MSFPLDSLNDFNPKKMWRNGLHLIQIVGIVVWIIVIVILLLNQPLSQRNLILIVICMVLLLIIGIGSNLYLDLGKVPTNWDDFEYYGLVKRDFPFTPEDGQKVFSYCYFPEGENLKETTRKYPAIIGLHGLNSHHHEMDRYGVPLARQIGALYFTYDAYGHGKTPGNKGDFRQIKEAKNFIDLIKDLPYVDSKRIAVIGMSLGAAKTMVAAYPHPDVKVVVALSGPYDFLKTRNEMKLKDKIGYALFGIKLNQSDEVMKSYSALYYMKPEGIVLHGHTTPTPNNDRLFLAANLDDPLVSYENTKRAIEILQLAPSNYRLYKSGGHAFEGNEFDLAVLVYDFVKSRL